MVLLLVRPPQLPFTRPSPLERGYPSGFGDQFRFDRFRLGLAYPCNRLTIHVGQVLHGFEPLLLDSQDHPPKMGLELISRFPACGSVDHDFVPGDQWLTFHSPLLVSCGLGLRHIVRSE